MISTIGTNSRQDGPRANRLSLTAIAIFLLALGTALNTPAQSSSEQLTRGAVLKGKAPINKKVLSVRLPRARELRLRNGLRVLLLKDTRVPTFSMQMVILNGGLSDPVGHHGLAGFTAAQLREGTRRRSGREIAEQIDLSGGTLSANAALASLTSNVNLSGLIENLEPLIDVFADVILNPTFPPEELERFKTQTATQYRSFRASPNFLAAERFYRVLYDEHPAGLITARLDSLKKTTTSDLKKFHSTYYRPNNSILVVVGDVSMTKLLPSVTRLFGAWKPAKVPEQLVPAAPPQKAARIYLIDRPGSVQTTLQLGSLSIKRTSKDYFPLLVMDKILGGGPSARLFLNIREDKGYTYSIYSLFNSSMYRGAWYTNSSVRTEVTGAALKEILKEFTRIRDEKTSESELEDAKRALVGSFALSLEQPQAVVQNALTQRLYDLPEDYWDSYPKAIAAITANDVRRAARTYLDPAHLQIVAVGDAAKIRTVLDQYGTVEVYDSDGRPVESSRK
jgi:predicted Zn-dependent peptidase